MDFSDFKYTLRCYIYPSYNCWHFIINEQNKFIDILTFMSSIKFNAQLSWAWE